LALALGLGRRVPEEVNHWSFTLPRSRKSRREINKNKKQKAYLKKQVCLKKTTRFFVNLFKKKVQNKNDVQYLKNTYINRK
jgi:hypothetical protein